jgi:hypothetical protein
MKKGIIILLVFCSVQMGISKIADHLDSLQFPHSYKLPSGEGLDFYYGHPEGHTNGKSEYYCRYRTHDEGYYCNWTGRNIQSGVI